MKALFAAVALFVVGTLLIAYGTDRSDGLGFLCWALAVVAVLASVGGIARRNNRCFHRSHRLRLPCWREATYDHQCGLHNGNCFNRCGVDQ